VSRSLDDKIVAEAASPEALVTIGTYHLGEALAGTSEDLRFMIDVNVGTALWLTQAVAPFMRERGSGAVVHVAARPGLEPTAGMATHGVSKAALIHLTRVLDLELRLPLDVAERGRTTTARHGLEPGCICLPNCSRMRSHRRRSPTSSSTSSAMPPRRSCRLTSQATDLPQARRRPDQP